MITAPSIVKAPGEDDKKRDFDVIGLGEVVIDLLVKIPSFPEPDEKLYVISTEKQAGGVTANFCVGVARQGLRVAFIGAVGDDFDGQFLRTMLVKENVADEFLVSLEDRVTPVNIVMVTEDGDKAILQSENMRLTVPPSELITAELVQKASHLHLTAINFETALKAVKLAKDGGLTISLDLEAQVVRDYVEELPELLEYVDLLIPNKRGASEFTGIEDPTKSSLKLLEYGSKAVIMTLGSEGAILSTRTKQKYFPAYEIENVVDTTGAGDAFNAGFITGFLLGKTLEESIKRGQATAVLKIQGMGAQEPLPTSDLVDEFLRAV
ncbi:MAG: carbohydrate kinase family protein [Candidatus Odinarchaeota archaeon]